jgi:GTPase
LTSQQADPSVRTILVGVDLGLANFDSTLDELGQLAQTAGMEPVARVVCKRRAPDAALFVGTGKADEIKLLAQSLGAQEILFDQSLSPGQQRNLERRLEMPVNDRTFLILEIFAQRARSHEGKLQVELARLQYLSTRLVRRWSHLERQRGGIGTRGGPGETQIELDRRMIANHIKRTKEQLDKVKRQRQTQRKQRDRRGAFNISLIGYTNAGKSTLFNALVKATRQLYLGEAERSVSLSDTVGFIRDLPHGLVDAFQATLQEAVDADLLLHVVDASNPDYMLQIEQVQRVLLEIGADKVPQILVFNKIDAMPEARLPLQSRDYFELDGKQTPRIFLSAQAGTGIAQLRSLLAQTAAGSPVLASGQTQSPVAHEADS